MAGLASALGRRPPARPGPELRHALGPLPSTLPAGERCWPCATQDPGQKAAATKFCPHVTSGSPAFPLFFFGGQICASLCLCVHSVECCPPSTVTCMPLAPYSGAWDRIRYSEHKPHLDLLATYHAPGARHPA